ncbi:MAG: epoxyqueuosine reductase QueH [Peptococcaceae bacterium]|nr:epoxyqueuosine reductase QueH [Peptococcaceae bacterium]
MSKPEILVHACCATCAAYVLEKLESNYTPVIYYYNPNIYPVQEYCRRRDELQLYAAKKNIRYIEEEYNYGQWQAQINGLEDEPEKGRRCLICFEMRLQRTAEFASQNHFPLFTTTLTISPHKNSKAILEIGSQVAKLNHVAFLAEDFKKQNGFQNTMLIAKKENFYRQNFCGCLYSQRKI